MPNISDNRLMEMVCEGDRSAVGELYEKYHDALLGFLCNRIRDLNTAEDIIQETFVRVLQRADTFVSNKCFFAWLKRIAWNYYIDTKRYEARRPHAEFSAVVGDNEHSEVDGVQPIADDQVEKLLTKEAIELLNKLIGTLPRPYREVVKRKAIDGSTFREISEETGVTKSALKSRYSVALNMLASTPELQAVA